MASSVTSWYSASESTRPDPRARGDREPNGACPTALRRYRLESTNIEVAHKCAANFDGPIQVHNHLKLEQLIDLLALFGGERFEGLRRESCIGLQQSFLITFQTLKV